MNNRIHHIAFGWLLVLLSAQLFVHLTGVVRLSGLDGEVVSNTYQKPTLKTVFDGSYQQNTERSIDVQTALLPFAVRTANQMNYSFFNQHTRSVITHPSGHILQQSYVKAHHSKINMTTAELEEWINQVKEVKDWTEKHGGQFMYILAANKADLAFGDSGHPRRVLNVIDSALAANHIPYFNTQPFLYSQDLNRVFSKNGIHWSVYGATQVVDSLIRRINHPKWSLQYEIESVEETLIARSSDADIEEVMNLLFPFKNEVYEYPIIRSSANGKRPVFLVIGDSFTWNFYDAELFSNIADSSSIFRYYNNSSYNVSKAKLEVNVKPQNPDFVWIVATEANLYEAAFGLDKEINKNNDQ